MFSKTFKTIGSLILVALSGYIFYNAFLDNWPALQARFFPCQNPIVYTLGTFDTRFGVSQEKFLKDLSEAEAIWEKPFGKNLFSYEADAPSTSVKVNLIYDSRQEATEKIKSLGYAVSDTRASYDSLKAKYDSLESTYLEDKSAYQARVTSFKSRQAAYEAQVNEWNKKGGAPKADYEALNEEADSLKRELAKINNMEESLNTEAGNINALATVVNSLARTLNINAQELNTIGEKRGEEFTEGEYKQSSAGREIDVYEFSTEDKLIRVLAHEFGHALGLEHVDDPNAIMYYLNENKNGKLTTADTDALKALCKIK